jgi:Ca-activated chloride channel family protein
MFDDFHFLRPLWLWLLLLIPVLIILLWRIQHSDTKWTGLIDKALLSHLLTDAQSTRTKWPVYCLAIVWSVAVLSIAGPSWNKLAQASFSDQKPLVLLVDLSPSMLVEDIKPSRLIKLRFKLIDFLKARDKGLTALVVYAGDAHVLAPLSDDSETLQALVPTLSPSIMPIPGSNIEEAMKLSLALLNDQGFQGGDILWLTDGVTQQAADNLRQILAKSSVRLSVIGVGTESGAPIPQSEQGFAKDSAGNIVLAKFDRAPLQKLVQSFSGIYSDLRIDNQDLEKVIALTEKVDSRYLKKIEQQDDMDQWDDFGQWLALIVLAIAAISFRRGVLLQVSLVTLLIAPFISPKPAQAMSWQDLWETQDQQATKAFQSQNYTDAAQQFSNPSWKAAAQYKSGDYEAAAESYANQQNASGYFNQGNALAKQGKLEEAIKAYDKSLLLEPAGKDAKENKALLEKLLEEKNQQSKDQQSKDQQSKDQQSKDQQSKDQQSKDQQSKDQQSKDQQSKDQQSKGQQSKDQQSKDQESKDQQSKDQESKDQESKDQESKDQQSKDQKTLDELKKEQAKKQQQALNEKKKQKENKDQDPKSNTPVQAELTQAQQKKQQELENWLGQLPEDSSRLVRNKLLYEFQKKRQAYSKGEWQPVEEKRW